MIRRWLNRVRSPEARERRQQRRPSKVLLSVYFVIHFGAIGVYVLPFGPGAYDWLPGQASEWAERTALQVKTRGLLPSMGYLSMFSLQQHWTLFGPEPIRWANSISVAAYFPTGDGEWSAKHYRIEGPREVEGIKLGRHREWRILSNLGYEGWGDVYRPLLAEALCHRLEAVAGRAPDGLTLSAEWVEVAIPWRDPPPVPRYQQHLGGFDCNEPADADGESTESQIDEH